jgi:hypothetical protein
LDGFCFHFSATLSATAAKVLIDKTAASIVWLNERPSPRTVLLRRQARWHLPAARPLFRWFAFPLRACVRTAAN